MPCSYEFLEISSSRDEEMSSGIEEKEAELNVGGMLECRILAMALRKFRNHSKNFAIPAKFRFAQFFTMIAKFRYHSENYYV